MLTSRTTACAPGAEPKSPSKSSTASRIKSRNASTEFSTTNSAWHHSPTTLTLLWMAISLPLVAWDTGYVLLRPLTMEGGSLHWPLYVPYKLYGTVDHVYGWKSFNAKNGFTGAQGFMNLIETLMYVWYVWVCFSKGEVVVNEDGQKQRRVAGRAGAKATLIGFSAAVMTLSKTVLYWLCEYYGGFDNIGHNPIVDLIILWIIPNGAWLVGPTYMIMSMGSEIIDGLTTAGHLKTH